MAAIVAIVTVMPSAFSASKVQTQRVFVPLEDEKTPEKPSEENSESSAEIPADALPSLEQNSDHDDLVDDPDTFGPESKPGQTLRNGPPPPVMRDLSQLPKPVSRMRELILEAAKKGNLEGLRNLVGLGHNATSLSIGGLEGDPIIHLKEASGDDEGYEILAILIEVLEAGYVHLDAGTDEELYVWPYFFAWPFEKLTPEMNVELYRVLTAGDVEDSKNSGRYIFFRVGIKPDGRWAFFVAGD